MGIGVGVYCGGSLVGDGIGGEGWFWWWVAAVVVGGGGGDVWWYCMVVCGGGDGECTDRVGGVLLLWW